MVAGVLCFGEVLALFLVLGFKVGAQLGLLGGREVASFVAELADVGLGQAGPLCNCRNRQVEVFCCLAQLLGRYAFFDIA